MSVNQVTSRLKANPHISPAFRRALPDIPSLPALRMDPRDPAVLTTDPAEQELRITSCEAIDRIVDLLGGNNEAVQRAARYLEYAAATRGLVSPFGGR